MLQSLSIKDFILIERLDLDFDKGFCVITGETGAGKSILLDSILFCLGGKFSNDVIRTGADACSVTLIFSQQKEIKSYLEEIELDCDDELVIKRIQTSSGRKKLLINDQIVTQKVMEELFDLCLELHGQHNHTSLINPSMHLEILDEYGNLFSLRKEIADLYKNWQKIENEIDLINKEKDNIERDIDYLSHMCGELESANISPEEEEKLAEIKQRLLGRDKEIKLIESVLSDIETSSINQVIGRAQRNMAKFGNNNNFDKINTNLEEAYDKIEDAKAILTELLNSFGTIEYTLEEVEDRLYEIRGLARKHSCQPSELSEFLKNSKEQLNTLKSKFASSAELVITAAKAKEDYLDKASKLSSLRQSFAVELENKTMAELSLLQMTKAIFNVEVISDNSIFSAKGVDKVRFIASTNPGMPQSPIDKIASGGELSRFMLGLRAALFDKGSKQTIIFDEIDVGISGAVADSIGERLRTLSNATQVIAITHQPQVAGKANQHILVEKTQHDSHTNIKVKTLNEEEKSRELARMISGNKITETGLKAAKELML